MDADRSAPSLYEGCSRSVRASRRFIPRHGLTGCDLTSHFLRPLTFRSAKHIAGTARKPIRVRCCHPPFQPSAGRPSRIADTSRAPMQMARCHVAHAIAKLAPPVDAIDDDERAHMTRRSTLSRSRASVLTNVAPRTPDLWRRLAVAALDFTLSGTDDSVTLSEALKSNEFVVLYFYNQDGSPGCSIEAQRFEAAIPQFCESSCQWCLHGQLGETQRILFRQGVEIVHASQR